MWKKLIKTNHTLPAGWDVVRLLSGILIIQYGLEIAKPNFMAGYTEWLTDLGMPFPAFMPYVGKVAELVGGVFLAAGFLTRLSAIPLILTMAFINFVMLEGALQSGPFYLLLLFACFLVAGSGRWSVDHLLGNRSPSPRLASELASATRADD